MIHFLETRLAEYKYDIKMTKLNTALARAVYENNKDIYWHNARIIQSCNNISQIRYAKAMAIKQYQTRCHVIIDSPTETIPALWDMLLLISIYSVLIISTNIVPVYFLYF